jgi:8-oxo-dGTP diphosphatase
MSNDTSRKIAVTLECFVRKDGKFLMLHRSPNKKIMPNVWMAPGGHRDFNEGLIACARREIKEETNLDIKNVKIKATGNAYVADNQTEFYFHFLFADYASGELKTSDFDGEFAWLTAEEIMELDTLLPEIKAVFPLLIERDEPFSFWAEYGPGNVMTKFGVEDPT